MKISDELKEKIEETFSNNEKIKNKLLSGDGDTIRDIGVIAHRGINPEEIIEKFDDDNAEYIYQKAKKMIEMQKIYKELCDCYTTSKNPEER